MENVLIQIKDAITEVLKRISPELDVFYEEVKKTEKGQGLEVPKTYYFVDIIPAGNNTGRLSDDKKETGSGIIWTC